MIPQTVSKTWLKFRLSLQRRFWMRAISGVWTEESLSRIAGIDAALLLVDRIGMKESPRGSNKGPVVAELREWAGNPLDDGPAGPWCAYAVEGAWKEAVRRLAVEIDRPLRLVTRTSGSTARWWQRGDADHFAVPSTWWPSSPPKPGDFIARAGKVGESEDADNMRGGGSGGDRNHTMMVTMVAGGRLYTVEGNTDGSGSSNGGEVWYKDYDLRDPRLVGHVRCVVRFA